MLRTDDFVEVLSNELLNGDTVDVEPASPGS